MQVEDVIIIGAGPAGMAAAIQLRRYGLHPRIFEADAVGGLLRNANLVENYPGFPRGISGARLVKLFARQAQNVGVKVTHDKVRQVDYEGGFFQVKTLKKNYQSRVVVIATGTRPLRVADLFIPEELLDSVYYEIHDLQQEEGKCVAIIGGGDAAFDYAMNLSKNNQVIILNRGDAPKCLPLLWERSQKLSSILYRHNAVVNKLTNDSIGGMMVDCQTAAGALQFHADYLIIAIGREANLDCLSCSTAQQISELEAQGILYIIGDVRNGIYRQTSIAVGDGVLAAMKIYPKLKELP